MMDLKDASANSLGAVEEHLNDMIKEGCWEDGGEDTLRILRSAVRKERESRQTPDPAAAGRVTQAVRQAAKELRKAADELEGIDNLQFALGVIRNTHAFCLGRVEHALEAVFDEMRKRQ
jgi:hypothetical protein